MLPTRGRQAELRALRDGAADLRAAEHDLHAHQAGLRAATDELQRQLSAAPRSTASTGPHPIGDAVTGCHAPTISPATPVIATPATPASAAGETGRRPVSRRGMMAAVTGAAAGGLLFGRAGTAAAANGDPINAGATTVATTSTRASCSFPNVALLGATTDIAGIGLVGLATAASGTNYGVLGENAGTMEGVVGFATSQSGANCGVDGSSSSTSGTGVRGEAFVNTGLNYGVQGMVSSNNGFGVFSEGRLKATGRCSLGAPNYAPLDADLDNGSISFYLDETANQLEVRVSYTTGGRRTATIALA